MDNMGNYNTGAARPGRGSFIRKKTGELYDTGNFKARFFVSLELTLLIAAFSPAMPFWAHLPGADWVMLALSSILFIYGSQPFIGGARAEFIQKTLSTMTLVILAIGMTYFYSLYAFMASKLGAGQQLRHFFLELAAFIVLLLLGGCIKTNAFTGMRKTSDFLRKASAALQPEELVEERWMNEARQADFLQKAANDYRAININAHDEQDLEADVVFAGKDKSYSEHRMM